MSNNEHLEAPEPHRAFRCTFGPVREMDLVWPPSDEDIDTCTIVHLDGGDRQAAIPVTSTAATAAPTAADGTAAEGIERGASPAASERAASEPAASEPAGSEPASSEPGALAAAASAGVAASLTRPVRAPRGRLKPTFGDCRDPQVAPRIRPLVFAVEPPPLPATSTPDESRAQAPEELALATVDAIPAAADVYAEPPSAAVAVEPSAEADGPPPLLFHPTPPSRDPEQAGAGRSAWLAVFFAAACALVTVVEYRTIFSLPTEGVASAGEQPPVPDGVSATDLAPGVPRAVPAAQAPQPRRTAAPPTPAAARELTADATARPTAAPPSRPAVQPAAPTATATALPKAPPAAAQARPADGRLAAAPPTRPAPFPEPSSTRVAVNVVDRGSLPAKVAPSTPIAPAPGASPSRGPAPAAAATAPAPAVPPPPAPVTVAAAAPEPVTPPTGSPSARPAPAMSIETVDGDEADIRSTLTRFRTAYSQLNARAARDVWPSVDTRALEKAFQSLKSQELRFDQCNLTVTGARAQAACKGRAIYVPRIGDQSPRYTAREWTFELRKADERWTIASARTL